MNNQYKITSFDCSCDQNVYFGGDAYTAEAKKVGTGSWTVYNIFRDHLGTITHLKEGSNITEYSFDAWGRRRDKDDWTMTLTSEPTLFADRGFTGHEYLEDFKLYNMNGRLYDPVVGRFLSPDPFIQDPGFTQSLNRYSYCLNNPLKFNDPSGEIWNLLFVWGGNWLMGGMDRWINQKQSFKQAFSPAKNPIVFSTNYSPSANKFSHPQVDAQTKANLPYKIGTDAFNKARQDSKGVYFMQFDARLAMPMGELGATTSIQAGLLFDTELNVAAYLTPSLGVSSGGGAFIGVSMGGFPKAKSISDVQGWGLNAGAIYAIGSRGFGVEGNLAIGESTLKLGGTYSPWGYGYGGAGYADFSYTFITNPINISKMTIEDFGNFLNRNLPNSNYSANDALQILILIYNTTNP